MAGFFEQGEMIYWISNEDRNFEVLEAKFLHNVFGDLIIECEGQQITTLSFCCFKHDEVGRKDAIEWAKHFLNAKIQEYHLKISELEQGISEITGDSEDDQYEKLKRIAIKDRLEGQLKSLLNRIEK